MAPVYSWFIEDVEKNILVDTGISSEPCSKYYPNAEDVTSFEVALDSVGLDPNDIDIIIQTHLHYDHCGNSTKCKNAKVIVQESELNAAFNGIYSHLPGQNYYPELFKDLKFQLIKGDKEITEGIKVLFTPGHSAGSQSVAVKTSKGTAIIAGFCSVEENFKPPTEDIPMPMIPDVIAPGIHIDSSQAYESVIRVKKMADTILPLHALRQKEL
jgi:glyoxylase-like metal-dependent hydrolase (beta-lactamase superfamily II)